MSVFLMGVHDPHTDKWKTVSKVGNGHDDSTIDVINKELKVVKISKVIFYIELDFYCFIC